jgi:hypothetical protein
VSCGRKYCWEITIESSWANNSLWSVDWLAGVWASRSPSAIVPGPYQVKAALQDSVCAFERSARTLLAFPRVPSATRPDRVTTCARSSLQGNSHSVCNPASPRTRQRSRRGHEARSRILLSTILRLSTAIQPAMMCKAIASHAHQNNHSPRASM